MFIANFEILNHRHHIVMRHHPVPDASCCSTHIKWHRTLTVHYTWPTLRMDRTSISSLIITLSMPNFFKSAGIENSLKLASLVIYSSCVAKTHQLWSSAVPPLAVPKTMKLGKHLICPL